MPLLRQPLFLPKLVARYLRVGPMARDALIELIGRCCLSIRVDLVRLAARHLPQRRIAGRQQIGGEVGSPRWLKDIPNRDSPGDEGDDPHLAIALRAQQGQQRIDSRQQQRPDLTCRLAMHRLLCSRLHWRGRPGMRGRINPRRSDDFACRCRQRGERSAQRRVRCRHAEVAMPMTARRRDQRLRHLEMVVAGSMPPDDRAVASVWASG